MYLSDLAIRGDRLDQFGQNELFWNRDLLLSPCGYLHGGPAYYRLEVSWKDLLPVDSSQLALFENVFLKREMMQQYVAAADIISWTLHTIPKIEAYNPHFRSSRFTVTDTGYFGMTWYLVYAQIQPIGLEAFQFGEQADYTNIISDPYTAYDLSLIHI